MGYLTFMKDILAYPRTPLFSSREDMLRKCVSSKLDEEGNSVLVLRNDQSSNILIDDLLWSWGDSGFPVFIPSEGLTAALLLSDILVPAVDLCLPFATFFVSIPPQEMEGKIVDGVLFSKVADMEGSSFFNYGLVSGTHIKICVFATWKSTVKAIGEKFGDIMRLCLGLSLYISEVSRGKRVSVYKKHTKAQRRFAATHPEPKVWMVGQDVKICPELLEAAKSSGKTRAAFEIHSRFVVRGHWRNQAHGEGRQLRKKLWIQPHWKGPDAGTLLRRAYRVETDKEEEEKTRHTRHTVVSPHLPE